LIEQLALLPKFVDACGFANAKRTGYEADDFLATAAAAEERRGGTVLVASGDRDTFQLASAKTTILYPVRAGEMARIGPAQVRDRYGVDPRQVPDFIALRGDPSDKLPGAPGVGAPAENRAVSETGRGFAWQKPTWAKAAVLARKWQLINWLGGWRRWRKIPVSLVGRGSGANEVREACEGGLCALRISHSGPLASWT
jgi:hypothetical protein